MTFKIIWDKKAHNDIQKLDNFIARRIILKVRELGDDPFSKDIKRLKGETLFRLRVGDYRILFDIIRDTIIVLKVGHRKNIYEDF
jgi:mRNA interferase RelE/StbE